MKIRIKFEKDGMMRFIGHLDMMRYFQKAMRRADIDMKYTEGFSPHQIMSFAAPLGVGITSTGEYLDIEVNSTKTSKESLQALNAVMVEGVRVTEYKKLPEGVKNAMSSVAAADYLVRFKNAADNPFSYEEMKKILEEFLAQTEILVEKQTKKSVKTIDLKPLIYELQAKGEENPAFFMRLCTGSTDNVKPELVLEAFGGYCEKQGYALFSPKPFALQIHRQEVYAKGKGQTFLALGDLGQDIE